jgi:hypothetical protein
MWCVADLTDEYLESMEEVLEIYERSYNPSEPVICCLASTTFTHQRQLFLPINDNYNLDDLPMA